MQENLIDGVTNCQSWCSQLESLTVETRQKLLTPLRQPIPQLEFA